MSWETQPEPESRVRPGSTPGQGTHSAADDFTRSSPPVSASGRRDDPGAIHIGKVSLLLEGTSTPCEVFTMSLGEESVQLLPFRNWNQLDAHKWTVRGKLPGTPEGLEVGADYVRVCGQTAHTNDPEACAHLEKAFNEWLQLELSNRRAMRQKARSDPLPRPGVSELHGPIHFSVDLDKRGQVHIHCLRGSEIVASVGLTHQGLQGLTNQGLLRKPAQLEVGALHDWIEVDGQLCSFEHGNNDSQKLARLLNEHYVPTTAPGQGKNILVFENPASPTGFDIQFPVKVGGVAENRRRTLNEAALELLQEPARCGLLQPGVIIKISPPTFIFKHKTPDGGEAYLPKSPANTVECVDDNSRRMAIDLSEPVHYTRIGVVAMTAILNHPSINRNAQPVRGTTPAVNPAAVAAPALPAAIPEALRAAQLVSTGSPPQAPLPQVRTEHTRTVEKPVQKSNSSETGPPSVPMPPANPPNHPKAAPNDWLRQALAMPAIRHDWFACLVYSKVAERFGNSREGKFGPLKCWSVAMGDPADIEDPGFKGFFLTEKGGFGYSNEGRMIRFHRGVAFLVSRDGVLEGIDVHLLAVGLDDCGQVFFIVTQEYASKFGVSPELLVAELARLEHAGAALLSVKEVLEGNRPLQVVWTVPEQQPDWSDPHAVETSRPAQD